MIHIKTLILFMQLVETRYKNILFQYIFLSKKLLPQNFSLLYDGIPLFYGTWVWQSSQKIFLVRAITVPADNAAKLKPNKYVK